MAKRKITKKELIEAGKDMNLVMGLVPPIDVSVGKEELIESILKEKDELLPEDNIQESTKDTLSALLGEPEEEEEEYLEGIEELEEEEPEEEKEKVEAPKSAPEDPKVKEPKGKGKGKKDNTPKAKKSTKSEKVEVEVKPEIEKEEKKTKNNLNVIEVEAGKDPWGYRLESSAHFMAERIMAGVPKEKAVEEMVKTFGKEERLAKDRWAKIYLDLKKKGFLKESK